MRKFHHLRVTALVLCSVTLVHCQSASFRRSPSSQSAPVGVAAVRSMTQMTQELLKKLPSGDHPRRMLFEFYLANLHQLKPNDDASWVGQKRSMDLLISLNQILLDDPFTEKGISLIYETFSKMEEIFKENPSYLVPQQVIDQQDLLAQKRFISDQANLMASEIKMKNVMINQKDKKRLLTLLNRIQHKDSNINGKPQIEARSLASQKTEFVLMPQERKLLEKYSTSSIQVTDQGDIFGGTEAIGKAQRIQYGARFLLAVLKKPETAKWKKVGMR